MTSPAILFRAGLDVLIAVLIADDAHVIVVGSNLRTDVPLMPLGSVPHKLLHMARPPVLVVPHRKATAAEGGPAESGQTAEPVAD